MMAIAVMLCMTSKAPRIRCLEGARELPAEVGESHDRQQHQRHEHDAALHEVGEADGEEPAEQGIGHDHPRRDPQAERIVGAERAFEQLAAGDDSGRV